VALTFTLCSMIVKACNFGRILLLKCTNFCSCPFLGRSGALAIIWMGFVYVIALDFYRRPVLMNVMLFW